MATESETPTEYVPSGKISGTQDTTLLRKRITELHAEGAGYRVTLADVAALLANDSIPADERIEKALKKATKELRAWKK